MFLNKFFIFISFLLIALNANALLGLKSRSEQKEQIAKARHEFALGNYQETIKLMKAFTLKDAPKRRIKRAYDLIAESYMALQEYDKAMLILTEALEFYPTDKALRLNLAKVYLLCDLNTRAIEEYKIVLKQDKNNTQAHLGLAQAMLKEGFYSQACQYFKKYVTLTNTKEAQVYYDYAKSHYLANNFVPALELALISLEQEPSADTKLLIAKIYKSQGKIQKALQSAKDAWLSDTSRKDIFLTYALWLAYEKEYSQQGLEMAQEYLKEHPQNRLALFIEYIAYVKQENKIKAKKTLEKITALKENGFISALASKLLENNSK